MVLLIRSCFSDYDDLTFSNHVPFGMLQTSSIRRLLSLFMFICGTLCAKTVIGREYLRRGDGTELFLNEEKASNVPFLFQVSLN
jgi:hypothetical protein